MPSPGTQPIFSDPDSELGTSVHLGEPVRESYTPRAINLLRCQTTWKTQYFLIEHDEMSIYLFLLLFIYFSERGKERDREVFPYVPQLNQQPLHLSTML